MIPVWLADVFSTNLTVSTVGASVFAVLGYLVARYRGRVKSLEYLVTHERIALAADDNLFGNVCVTWQGNSVTSLFLSKVTLKNAAAQDLRDFRVIFFAGEGTVFLNSHAVVLGTPFAARFTKTFKDLITTELEAQPTPVQWKLWGSQREYEFEVLNRSETLEFSVLTTIGAGITGPLVFAQTQSLGLKLNEKRSEAEVFGTPTRLALPAGVVICLGILTMSAMTLSNVWTASAICLVAGLVVLPIGALAVKLGRTVFRLLSE